MIEQYLENSNFNDVDAIILALKRAQLDAVRINDEVAARLGAMMKRRHWIVHRADRNDRGGSGQHPARTIDATTVRGWRNAVASVCQDIVAELD